MAETIYDAENATADDTDMTQAAVPLTQAPTTGTGALARFRASAAANGDFGYYFYAPSGAQLLRRVAITSNLVQSIRLSIMFPSLPGALRAFLAVRNTTPANAIRFRCEPLAGAVRLTFIDNAAANTVTIAESLTLNTWYDLSMVLQANASAGVNDYLINLYTLNGTTPINTTAYTSTGYNVGTLALNILDLGFNDTVAAAAEMYMDNIHATDAKTTEQGPLYAATTRGKVRNWRAGDWH